MIRKFFLGLLGFIFITAIGGWIFWPDNWAAKGPILDFMTGKQLGAPADGVVKARYQLPEGFKIGVFADGVTNARMMRMTRAGDLLVSSMRPGEVILLHRDDNGDGVSDGRTILFSGLDRPHGLALRDGYLYVAETGGILRTPFDAAARTVGEIERINDTLPPGENHNTRTIGFGPDGWLYVSVGSTCNVCIEEHPYRAAMLRMRPDGSDVSVYATGLRNTVGFDWQPGTGRLYGTDNGRDLLGNDVPNCEINLIEQGEFYGFPYTYDNRVVDPDFGAGHEAEIASSRVMAYGIGAHVAPLGIKFLRPGIAPSGYGGKALVALHGSWNRSVLSGYKVVALTFGEDGEITESDFLTGFEKDEDVIGRPVDIEQGPDGAIYVSDDYAGAVYRIGWGDMAVSGHITEAVQSVDPLAELEADDRTRLAAAGAVIYQSGGCAQCHDPAVAAEGIQVKQLQALTDRYDIMGLAALLNAPPGSMPRPDLTDSERRALAVYLLTLD